MQRGIRLSPVWRRFSLIATARVIWHRRRVLPRLALCRHRWRTLRGLWELSNAWRLRPLQIGIGREKTENDISLKATMLYWPQFEPSYATLLSVHYLHIYRSLFNAKSALNHFLDLSSN